MKQQGFTLFEMIITLSIIAILSAMAFPSYTNLMRNQAMTSEINRMIGTIQFARNQSIILSQHIILCPSISQYNCDASGQWNSGWIVFIDANKNRNMDDNDQLLLVEPAIKDPLTAISSNYRTKIRFMPSGFSPGTNMTIRFCDDRGSQYAKSIVISNVGRPRLGTNVSCS